MPQQTIESVKALLPLLQQPAFCVSEAGDCCCNRAAQALMPGGKEDLALWMGESSSLWQAWDRQSTLELPLQLADRRYSLTIQPLADGDLFLLAPDQLEPRTEAALATASQVLRQPLNDLSAQLQLLSRHLQREGQEALLDQMAAMNRQICRMARISGNLADLEALLSGQYKPRLELLELHSWLEGCISEAKDLCRAAGRTLNYEPFSKPVYIHGDPALLERLFYNLLSNAIKFGTPDTPITCRTELREDRVLLRLENRCADGNAELLRAAFTRLEQRDLLPDPRWGMGLGLPLVLAIARLHGGMAAVEAVGSDRAAVTVLLPKRNPFQSPILEAQPPISYTGGMRRSLAELSDCLPNEIYHSDAL